MANDLLEQAIGLVQAGKLEAARQRLEFIIRNDRSNITAWHWYARTWPKAGDKARIWQSCLRFNPGNELAQQALKDLNFDPQKQAAPAPKIPAPEVPRKRTGSPPWFLWLGIASLGAVAVFVWTLVRDATPKDPQEYRHTAPVEYYLYVPRAYSADEEWPLFVGIHGAGSSGLECWQLWQTYADRERFILLCPSIPGFSNGYYQDVGETTVWNAVTEVKKDYRVRPRMFLSGFSAGAYFIQGFTYHYPQYVSGLSILSAGLYLNPNMFAELIPMLVVIGDRDDQMAVRTSQSFVNDLQGYGFDVNYRVMPGVGHAVTGEGVRLTIDLFRKTIGK